MSEVPCRKRKRKDSVDDVLQDIEEVDEQKVIKTEIVEAVNQEEVKILREKEKFLIEKENFLMDKEKQLMDKEKQLMDKEKQLMDKEKQLMDKEKQLMDKEKQLMDKDKQLMEKEKPVIWKSIGSIEFDSDTPWPEDNCCLKLQLAKEAGLRPATLYIRHEAEDLWNFLNDKEQQCALISGYPGVGKSSVAWAWVCWMATKKNKNVLWIHYDIEKPAKVVNLKSDGCTKLENALSSDSVPDFIKKGDYDFVVLDSVVQSSLSILLYESNQSLILVSSVGLQLPDRFCDNTEEFVLESWTLSDYQNACKNEAIYDALPEVKHYSTLKEKSEFIEARFYLAGHCARYFFCYSSSNIERMFNGHIQRVPSFDQYVSMTIHTKVNNTVHHLLAVINKKITLCSSYVCQRLMLEINFDFLKRLLQWCKKTNPLLEGQVFELAFLAYLKAVHDKHVPMVTSIKLCESMNESRGNEFWCIKGGYCHFEPTKMKTVPAEEWLIPKKIDQPTYDLVQLNRDKKMLRLVQLTRAKSHTIKCEYVSKLLVALELGRLKIKLLDFVVLFPMKGTKPKITYEDEGAFQEVLDSKKISLFGDTDKFSVRFLRFNTELLFD